MEGVAMQLAQNQFYTLTHDENSKVLKLVWLEATSRMTEEDFKQALISLADYTEKHKAHGLLIDVAKFRYNMPKELGEWRAGAISPRYNKAGVKKFAFVHTKEFPEASGPGEQYPGEDFLTKHFSSEENAQAWLAN